MSAVSIPSTTDNSEKQEKLIRDHERYVTGFHAVLDHASEVPVLSPVKPGEVADPRMFIDHTSCAPEYVNNPFPVVSHDYFIKLIDQGRITNHMQFYMCILPPTTERRPFVWALYEVKSPDRKHTYIHDTTIYPGFNVPVDPTNYQLHQVGSVSGVIQGHKKWNKNRLYPYIRSSLMLDNTHTPSVKCSDPAKAKQYRRNPIFVVEVEDAWYRTLHGNPNAPRKRKLESA